jgi:transposase
MIVEWIEEKYSAISGYLDERGRRRWAAAEARSLGWGGISAVSLATGISDRTIRNGIQELVAPAVAVSTRQRRAGAGRPRREHEQPELLAALNALVEGGTRGDPMSPLRWTCKSTHTLAQQLKRQKFEVSSSKVGQLLRLQGYSLQANRKTSEGKQHPDRDAQFEYIAARCQAFERTGQPVISIDAKKKETLGKLKNQGRAYHPAGKPTRVKTHDFPDPKLGKAIPYGVYDLTHNEAGVSVGISRDTAEFAVASIGRWWQRMGNKRYPQGTATAHHSRQRW